MKQIFTILTLALIASCTPIQQATQTSKQTFTFDYTPKSTNQLGSAGMVLAFIKPYYATEFKSSTSELFKAFNKSLSSDIEELIISKGFTMKGPYVSYDEMVFEDKKGVEMAIIIEISPSFTAVEGGWKYNTALLGYGETTYSYSGKVSLVGKINISGVEPLTYQKIWSKSVSIPNVENISIATTKKYTSVLTEAELMNDPGIYNEMGKALQAQYIGIMDKIAAHFSVDEFTGLKTQIKELKSKKGF
jgi:hypothetical protein